MSEDQQTATLLVQCPDQKGLVAALAQRLFELGANILKTDQHADPTLGMFFQRICFDRSGLDITRSYLEERIADVADRFQMKWEISYGEDVKRLAIMVSKYDHCLYDLLLRHRAQELPCEIPLIISNHPDLQPVAEQFGIDFHHVPITKETKAEQEEREVELMKEAKVDVVVMARYMQILTERIISAFPSRIINIHHSFLPAFLGGRPYHQAHDRGVKLIGATAHYATVDLDEGPIIAQDVIRATHRDTVQDLIRKGRDVERRVLSRAVRWHLQDRILVCGRKTVVLE